MIDQDASPFENKRTAIAILLCLVLVMIYSEVVLAPLSRASVPSVVATNAQTQQQTPGQIAPPQAQNGTALVAQTGSSGIQVTKPTAADFANAQKILVTHEFFNAQLNTLGGRLESFKLSKYMQVKDGKDAFEMVAKAEGATLPLGIIAGPLNDESVVYTLIDTFGAKASTEGEYVVSNKDLTLLFSGKLSNGTEIKKTFVFHPNTYLFDLNVSFSSPTLDGSRAKLEWNHFESDMTKVSEYDFKGISRLSGTSVTKTLLNDVAEAQEVQGSDTWIEVGDKYFTAGLIPTVPGQNTSAIRNGNTVSIFAAGTPQGGEFKLYLGPKEINVLKGVGYDLQKSIDLGFFSALAHPLLDLLRFFYKVFGNYGLSIVLLTLLIKALFLPLTKKSFKSMAAMQDLQPKIKLLREKYPNDATKLNQEMMALYKKEGVNPMGGCLPMLIQLPVFLGLYNALLNSIDLRHAPFALWINDLSSPENFQLFGIAIPVMVILMGITMFIQQWTTPTVMDPTQKKIMMFMPIVMTFLFMGFPAGLTLYWLVNNSVSIIQQWFIKEERSTGPTKATALASIAIFGFAYILTLI
ncbi:MAG: membrane protein insertase YidC [bacterium]|nr:membrane protein insertase YidC [bacterium]